MGNLNCATAGLVKVLLETLAESEVERRVGARLRSICKSRSLRQGCLPGLCLAQRTSGRAKTSGKLDQGEKSIGLGTLKTPYASREMHDQNILHTLERMTLPSTFRK